MDRSAIALIAARGKDGTEEYFACALRLEDLRRVRALSGPRGADVKVQKRNARARSRRTAQCDSLPIIVFVDGGVAFAPIADDGVAQNLGQVVIQGPANIGVIEGAVPRSSDAPLLDGGSVPAVIIPDRGLKRFAKMRATVAVGEPVQHRFVGAALDRRFRASAVAQAVVIAVPFFRHLTEMEKSAISNRSRKMFTLTGIRNATEALLAGLDLGTDKARIEAAVDFWTAVGRNIPEWQLAADHVVKPSDLRREFVHAHSLALAAIARAGNRLLASRPQKWKAALAGLNSIDWRRGNTTLWEGRAMNAGRLSKHNVNVTLTANVVKQHLGVPLSEAEGVTEREFKKLRKRAAPSK